MSAVAVSPATVVEGIARLTLEQEFVSSTLAARRWCVLGKGTLPPFPTLSDESINQGLVCVARIPSSTDLKDPDAHVLDG